MFSPLVERALRTAIAAHAGQVRKSDEPVPYVVHPLHVALLLARWGQDDEVLAAGLLHDVVEDCPDYPLARIEAEFGHQVARIVGELTEDKSKSWEERKRFAVEHVPHMSPQAATVKAADKLHNLRTLALELGVCTSPDELWKRFRRGRERTLAMSEELIEALAARVDPKVVRSLRAALKAVHEADAAARGRTVPARD